MPMNSTDLTKLIKSKVLEIGFQKVGISSPTFQLEYNDYYDNWLTSGKNGTMKWLETQKEERKTITNYFPQVKSIISVAINYFTGTSKQVGAQGSSKINISNYAWGKDYHVIVKQKLSELLQYIKTDISADVSGLICVDSSPIMEKQWAQSGGLGWQGKHTILINDELGSWVFLGELLLDTPLDFDEPFKTDLCGSCTACIDACPTQALSEYQLDATKCISYLTAEYKLDFSITQKNSINRWVYGCDICQQVCPWNKKKQQYTNEDLFKPIREVREYTLSDWLNLEEDKFNDIFDNSPIRRIKYNRFMRNISSIIDLSNGID